MRRVTSFLINTALLLAGLWSTYGAQLWPQAPPATFEDKLASLTSRAALIFVGQVISTTRQGSVVAVKFRVDQAVAGQAGGTFTLREWAGLWPQGQYRYAIGDRALVFLLGTSEAGFSSPVDGAEGFVPVSVQGADAPALLDTRRLASSLGRLPGTPLATPSGGAMPLSSAIALVRSEIAEEAAAGLGRLNAPVRRPVATGLSGVTSGSLFGPESGRPAQGDEPRPILRPGAASPARRDTMPGAGHETR